MNILQISGFECGGEGVLSIIKFTMKLLDIIFIVAPTLLIVLLLIDFAKAVIASDEGKMKEASKLAIKRTILCVCLFLVKPITGFVVKAAGNGNILSCINIAVNEDISKYKLGNSSLSDTTKKTNNLSGDSKSVISNTNGTNEDGKIVEYKLDKNFIVLAHYHGKKISKYKIKILNKNGKKMKNSKFNFKINKPIATIKENGEVEAQFAGTAIITVSPKTNPSNKQKIDLAIVKGTYTKVTTSKKLKVKNLKTGEKETLPKGTEGEYNGASFVVNKYPYQEVFYYHGDTLKVGNNYYNVSYKNVTKKKYSISSTYSKEIAEEFINSNEFESDTKYLFWMNLGTQVNYLFKGKKGKWKLYKTFDINSGDILGLNPSYNSNHCNGQATETVYGHDIGGCDSNTTTNISAYRLDPTWKGYWQYGGDYTVFNHKSEGGGFGAWHEGYVSPSEPRSHGCVRHKTEDLIWIRDHMSILGGSRIIKF